MPNVALDLIHKDLRLVLEIADEPGLLVQIARRAGVGELDPAPMAIMRVYQTSREEAAQS